MRRRLLILGWLFALGLSAALPLSALFRGIIHVGPGSLHLQRTLDRPLIAVASDVYIEHGSSATVVALFGDVHAAGRSRDDIVTVGGRVYAPAGSRIDGDVLSVAGGVYKAPGALTTGRIGGALHRWDGKFKNDHRDVKGLLTNSIRLGLAAGLALVLAGACLTIIFPWQVVLISSTLRASPVKSFTAGLMAVITFLFLVVPLGLSLAGLPFALLLTAAASLAWLFGMTASAVVLGKLIAHRAVSLLWASAAGLLALAVAMAVPVIGPLVVTAVGLVGAGALAVSLMNRARPATPML